MIRPSIGGSGFRAPFVRRLRSAGRDERGVAAVEFAVVLPFMLFLYMGMSAVTEAVSCSRAVATLARTLADITSQQPANQAMTDTQAQEIFNASTAVLSPFSSAGVKMTLSNVEFVANAASSGSNNLDAKTRWTVTFSGGTLRPCVGNPKLAPVANGASPSPTTMPLGLYTSGFLIVADVTYAYTPSFGVFNWTFGNSTTGLSGSFTMARTQYMRPRQQANIGYPTGSAQVCPIAPPQQP